MEWLSVSVGTISGQPSAVGRKHPSQNTLAYQETSLLTETESRQPTVIKK
jgi:hypothetical protein